MQYEAIARHSAGLLTTPSNFGGRIIAESDDLEEIIAAAETYSECHDGVTVDIRDQDGSLVRRVREEEWTPSYEDVPSGPRRPDGCGSGRPGSTFADPQT